MIIVQLSGHPLVQDSLSWSGPLHPTIPLKQNKTSSVKQVDKIYAHNKIVFYSCNRELHIDLAHDATVGECCRK